jgi:hypothetical protein
MSEGQTPGLVSATAPDPQHTPTSRSRRALLGGLAAAAASALKEQARAARPDPPEIYADVDPGSLLIRLVQRITFGATQQELALANTMGYQGYLEYQLDPFLIDDAALGARLGVLETLNMSYNEYVALNNISRVIAEFTEATILRAVMSRRQLYERMIEFWNDHFNIYIRNDGNCYLNPIHDRLMIRPNAMGRFADLLLATAQSAAMLYYLNNDVSTASNPNENYARELMELHTLGTGSGFTQQDVSEVARCFTGWTWWRRDAGDLNGSFRFDPSIHDDGEKIVLGHVIPSAGIDEGLMVLDILASHPATASFIARKICRKFIGESCPRTTIDQVARVYSQTRGDVKAMLRAALLPNVLASSPPKYKRPFHMIVSALRALPVTINTTAGLHDHLDATGHRPFHWNTPDGYPDTLSYWQGHVIGRWNFGAALAQGHIAGVTVNHAAFFQGLNTASAMADRINHRIFAGELPAVDVIDIGDYLRPDPPTPTRQWEALGLAIGSPAFQWY